MDWDAFRADIHLSTHFLDNIIDVNKYPLPEIDALSQAHPPHRARRDGLRRRARAARHRRTTRAEGVEFGRKVMEFLDVEAKKRERAARRTSVARSPSGRRAIWGPDETCARDENGKRIRPMQLLRNCNVTTVAPTGTISHHRRLLVGGLEPLFAVAFMRNQAGVMMPDVNEDFVAIAKSEGWYSDELMERIAKEGHIHFAEVPEKWQRVFVTANADHARVARADAGRLPGALRLGDQQDDATSRTPRPSRTCARSTSWRTT